MRDLDRLMPRQIRESAIKSAFVSSTIDKFHSASFRKMQSHFGFHRGCNVGQVAQWDTPETERIRALHLLRSEVRLDIWVDILTKISRSKGFEKQLGKVPDFIRKKVVFWVFLVESKGLAEVMKSPGFHDEPLKGQRIGERSVRMNKAYRMIYRVIEDRVHIELLEVNKHEY